MIKAAKVMTIAQARRRYAGNWLALEVVARDPQGEPGKVHLLAKARTRDELCDRIEGVPCAYITFGGPPGPPWQDFLLATPPDQAQ
jgi:hypothetical protein